jgi:hypothetical protein
MTMMKLEELLSLAYEVTHQGFFGASSTITMSTNWASNQSLFTQTFRLLVCPMNNRVPKKSKDGGTIVSTPIGYKELIVGVDFGDSTHWSGPSLSWLYMDRSEKWDGEQKSGGIEDIDTLREISNMLNDEARRIFDIEMKYQEKHGSLEGLVVEGYAVVE